MADFSRLDPDLCACSKKTLPEVISSWKFRARDRLVAILKAGGKIDMNRVKHEAQLVTGIPKAGGQAFAEQNGDYGHFCDDCPYRKKRPLVERLAVDPTPGDG